MNRSARKWLVFLWRTFFSGRLWGKSSDLVLCSWRSWGWNLFFWSKICSVSIISILKVYWLSRNHQKKKFHVLNLFYAIKENNLRIVAMVSVFKLAFEKKNFITLSHWDFSACSKPHLKGKIWQQNGVGWNGDSTVLCGSGVCFPVEQSVQCLCRSVPKAFLLSCDRMETQDRHSVQFAYYGMRHYWLNQLFYVAECWDLALVWC